jgi:phage host-nuclease inhibitor protein Gam
MQDFEKLGLFYLGRSYDPATREAGDDLVLYDSRDLVTHAVCVGMTGSGKTGLCLSLLEEAAIDHVPAIAIDPKGDLSNLLLTFPELRGEDFAPWVDEGEARKAGLKPAEYAAQQATLWKEGLAEWGQDGARIQRLRESAEFRIYTPGSQAGLPVSILKSFSAPPEAIRDDAEALNERVATTAGSLLGLLGIDADPMQSPEHILISRILADAWKAGDDLDIAALIPRIQHPPFQQVGVIDLESFFPAKDRFALAMRMNNLLASPGFEAWVQGEPLDVDAMLHAPDGKPRISILSIAHLGEPERMFFVSLLLNQVLGWARTQPGTSSLRAILYMDEIYGYFPPVATPPSKRPLLTLLKQARAYGLGVVLATQNPADLDYKGLSNTGTWFIGRLQAERDKMRVLEGLEGAATAQSAPFDRQEMETILSGLGKRIFLMHNVHEDHPQVFQVRWALSYLRGPLTRGQIKGLMDPLRTGETAPAPATPTTATTTEPAATAPAVEMAPTADRRPLLPPDVPQFFLPLRTERPDGSSLLYRPAVLGCGQVYFQDAKADISYAVPVALLAPLSPGAVTIDWPGAARVEVTPEDLESEPAEDARFEAFPPAAAKAKSYTAWTKAYVDALYRGMTLKIFKSPSLGAWSKPTESERNFRVRLQQEGREARDDEIARIRSKYAPKLATLEEKIRRAEQAVEREAAQARTSGFSSVIRLGSTILGAVMGRKTLSSSTIDKAGTTLRTASQTMKETGDVGRARETVESLRKQYADLDAKLQAEIEGLAKEIEPLTEVLETVALRPKKSNITTKLVALVWRPYWSGPDGTTTSAWDPSANPSGPQAP